MVLTLILDLGFHFLLSSRSHRKVVTFTRLHQPLGLIDAESFCLSPILASTPR